MRTNFDDYGLPQPVGLLRADLHRLPLRPGLEEVLDAIVCDPPYGVRAGGRKTAARDYTPRNRDTHIPATDPYQLGECLRDLLDAAARLLRIGAWTEAAGCLEESVIEWCCCHSLFSTGIPSQRDPQPVLQAAAWSTSCLPSRATTAPRRCRPTLP